MKKILFTLTAAALSLGWCSCSNNQAASTNAQSDKTSPASSSSPASADPSSGAPLFTATIDGQTYSSSVSTGLENIALNQLDDNQQPYLVLTLGDVKSQDDQKTTRNFRIVVAKKTGSVHLTRATEIPNYGMSLDYLDGDFSQYRGEDMILNVSELSNSRVKGNFSGKMYNNSPQGLKKSIMVDAKFDLPIAPPVSPS
jgi:hypothetical protein